MHGWELEELGEGKKGAVVSHDGEGLNLIPVKKILFVGI